MDRRTFVASAAAAVGGVALGQAGRAVAADGDRLSSLLAQLEADPSLVEDSWQYRSPEISRGVGTGRASTRRISARATDMIIQFEVVSRQRYERLYSRPIWPKGKSGVTIGIGYDLRFVNRAMLERDWGKLLDAPTVARLAQVLRKGGVVARDALPLVREVQVPWTPADAQFRAFVPYAVAQTEDVFANSGALSDDSFGALVSLVYNRGAAIPRGSDSRREMLAIHDLMAAKNFAAVPAQIRSMKRLWPGPDARGLIIRREAEAVLFEVGMA